MAGTWIARFSIAICLLGVAIPMFYLGPPETTLESLLYGAVCFLIPSAAPFIGLGSMAWAWRRSTEISLTIAIAILVAISFGWWAWWEGAQDPKGLNLIFSAFFAPLIQLLIWGIGYGLIHLQSRLSGVNSDPP